MNDELYAKIIMRANMVGLCASGVTAVASLYIYVNKTIDQNETNSQLRAKIAELEAQIKSKPNPAAS